MYSKISYNDFANKLPKNLDFKKHNLQAIVCEDPYLEIIFRNKIKNDFKSSENESFRLYSGDEITKAFVEDNFLNLSLFLNLEPVIVINADQIEEDVLELINAKNVQEMKLVLFYKSIKKNIEKILIANHFQVSDIQLAKFWEGPKLWSFLIQEFGLNVTPEWTRYILENVEATTESFYKMIHTLKLEYGHDLKNISPKEFFDHFEKEKYDQFELVQLYQQNKQKFFEVIEPKVIDFDWTLGFSMFMQSHLVKVLYPQEISAKEKPNKYELSILNYSEKETRSSVKESLKFFSKLEIMAKNRDLFIVDEVRKNLLV